MTHLIRQAACALLLVFLGAADLSAQSADVGVTQDAALGVIAGTNLTYTITVINAGPSDAANVSLSDTVPANTTFVSLTAPAGWTTTTPAVGGTGTITSTRSTLASGSTQVFTLVVRVSPAAAAGTILSNTATATTTNDPVPTNNSATATTTVQRSSDLTVTKNDSVDPVTIGNNLTYTITVSNAGPSNAANVGLMDVIPANTSVVSVGQIAGPSFSVNLTGAAFTATSSTFAAGASAVFAMSVNVSSATFFGTTLSNTATVTSTTFDPNAANNSDTETTATSGGVVSPDLTVTKTDSPDSVLAGTNLTYTVTVTNNGPSAAPAVTLSDTLPANTTFVSLTAPAGWTTTTPAVGGTGTVTSTRSTLAIGSPQVFMLVVRVNPAAAAGTMLSNTATATTTNDPVPTNNSATATTTVQRSSDLTVTKNDSVDPVTVGNNLTYTITVSNAGPSDAANVGLTDVMPANTTLVSVISPAGWTTTPPAGGSGTVTSVVSTLAAGASAVFTMVVNVSSATFFGTTLSNTATVTSTTPDPNPANNSDTESTATSGGVGRPDLTVTKTDSPDPVSAGTNLTYTITVTNAGPDDASTVSLSDTVPANTTFVSLTAPAGWTTTTPAVGGTGAVTATRSTLAIGSPQVFMLVVRVNAATAAGTTLANTATVSTTGDPVIGNNADTETTTVVTALSSVYPTAGTTLGGTTVTFDGGGFESGMAVTFGGVPAAAVKVLDATRLLAIAPAHATGAVDVVLAKATATATLASGYTYLDQPPAESASDLDGDGTSDLFEMRYSLDPSVGSDVALDPDVDGLSNLQEFQAGSHPRGFFKRYLAEGATGIFFDVRFALLNPDAFPAAVLLRFLKADGTTASRDISVASLARATLDAEESVAALAAAEFSTVVESDIQVVADRTMSWVAAAGGAHAETSIASLSTTWFLAEGATHSGFELFYLLQNPNGVAANVTVTYLLPSPAAPIVKTYPVAANTRFNIWVDFEPGLGATDVSATITSDVPIIVERAMYLNGGGLFFGAGHESAGVTATATSWFLAEGATGPFFDLFILIANPNGVAAEVTATYLLPDGSTVLRNHVVAPNSRFNIWVDLEGGLLADTAVSTTIVSTNGVGILVERAMWWPTDPTQWFEAHNSPGTTATGTRWALADGEVGGANATETYVLIANTSPFAGSATVTLLFEDGTTAAKPFQLVANSRLNVDVGAEFAAANGRRFGTIIESTGAMPAQIVVERAMYFNSGGRVWAAGTNAVATRLQ